MPAWGLGSFTRDPTLASCIYVSFCVYAVTYLIFIFYIYIFYIFIFVVCLFYLSFYLLFYCYIYIHIYIIFIFINQFYFIYCVCWLEVSQYQYSGYSYLSQFITQLLIAEIPQSVTLQEFRQSIALTGKALCRKADKLSRTGRAGLPVGYVFLSVQLHFRFYERKAIIRLTASPSGVSAVCARPLPLAYYVLLRLVKVKTSGQVRP